MQEEQKRLEEEAEQAEIIEEQKNLANISRAPTLKNDESNPNYNFKKGQDSKSPVEPSSPDRRGSKLAPNQSALSRDSSGSPLKRNNDSKMESKQGSALEKMKVTAEEFGKEE